MKILFLQVIYLYNFFVFDEDGNSLALKYQYDTFNFDSQCLDQLVCRVRSTPIFLSGTG